MSSQGDFKYFFFLHFGLQNKLKAIFTCNTAQEIMELNHELGFTKVAGAFGLSKVVEPLVCVKGPTKFFYVLRS